MPPDAAHKAAAFRDALERDWLAPFDAALRTHFEILRSPHWIYFRHRDGPADREAQGWKIHVSARPASLEETLERALPVLIRHRCEFKIVPRPLILNEFNCGLHGPAAVGKAITIYPAPGLVERVGAELVETLGDLDAPQVMGDKRVSPDAPVYYRFGPFSANFRLNDWGVLEPTIQGPDGQIASGLAKPVFAAPDWSKDPFEPSDDRLPSTDGSPIIGDHYKVTGAVSKSHRGSTFRAIDLRSGEKVVIREARAFTNETSEGDARTYLRSEIAALEQLADLDHVPRIVDHFAYGPDEYLVVSELGSSDLRMEVYERGVLALNGPESVLLLAKNLLTLLDAIHERGVIHRDVAPKNIVALKEGGWGLVDFELSSVAGRHLFGWTAGYSSQSQRKNRKPDKTDDYRSLGYVMVHAITGFDPIIVDKSETVNRDRTLDCLRSACPSVEIVELVTGLTDPRRRGRIDAAARLRGLDSLDVSPEGVPNRPVLFDTSAILANLLKSVAAQASAISRPQEDGAPYSPQLSVQNGAAGILAELSFHGAAGRNAAALAAAIRSASASVPSPPGFLFGRTGMACALFRSARPDDDVSWIEDGLLPSPDELAAEHKVDVAQGLAGIGLGYLDIAEQGHLPSEMLERAGQCAERILDHPEWSAVQFASLPAGRAGHGISIAHGFAHGRAGVAMFLASYGRTAGCNRSLEQARSLFDEVALVVPRLAEAASTRAARPMCASWCQGLAGMGASFARASILLDEPRYRETARIAADGCIELAPRVPLATQCCGLAGIGDLLLDMQVFQEAEGYRAHAEHILELILARSGGTASAPRVPGTSMTSEGLGWGTGSAGVLAFLRRLKDPSSPRLWMGEIGTLHA